MFNLFRPVKKMEDSWYADYIGWKATRNGEGLLPKETIITDALEIPANAVEICIDGAIKNKYALANLPSLTSVKVLVGINQAQFNELMSVIDVKTLSIINMRCTDLSGLEQLPKLEHLDLEWNAKATALWDLGNNPRLTTLRISDFRKVHDFSALATAPQLIDLEISGGFQPEMKQTVSSLNFLTLHQQLRSLSLCNLKVIDASQLRPLGELHSLERLELSNQFETKEYAWLSVHLPSVECRYFTAYIAMNQVIGDKNVMVIGKGKPLLNSVRDKARLEKYAKDFAGLQESFR